MLQIVLRTCVRAWMLVACASAAFPQEQGPPPARVTLFQNVRVFNGKDPELSPPCHVLVRGNVIERISEAPIPTDRRGDTLLIDGGGRTLMPGLIDMHWHAAMASTPLPVLLSADHGYLHLLAGVEAGRTLLRGFTSVRDMGGPTFPLQRAINEGVLPGPRIWPSGAALSQTGGHFDFRSRQDVPRAIDAPLSNSERTGAMVIADGPDEVRLRTREQLMLGATQIKLAAGGGVSSNFDPLDVTQYTEAEFRAAVEAAENWGTYVTVHAYTPRSIQTAIRGGVKCIEHGHLLDAQTARLMADHNIWLCIQPFLADDDDSRFPEGSPNRIKQLQVAQGTDNAITLAKRHGIRLAWGSDILFDARRAARHGTQLVKMLRWYTPAETLILATSRNAELLQLSGPRNPYPGKLGVVAEGALADLLLVDGDPLAKLELIEDPDRNFVVIMKDGRVYKNTLSR